ncbi:MAG TPA: DNA (cytosine-5-)-methyltransferase, partial [Leclercia sp.]|nr:DNA (cytosine-5-)-methyltransferase [Leclercia sp.]
MMESALELAKKSTASVQALLSQLLEIYDARTLAHLLNAQGDSHWSPAI